MKLFACFEPLWMVQLVVTHWPIFEVLRIAASLALPSTLLPQEVISSSAWFPG